ncbi:helicase-related protein [Thermococcus gorgonarius]|uniref:DNA helicase n=1 Tax=Thermococcus gorgonarius TaxID=71997 RepID=A0A2Z2M7N2_THEGO|nr:helicase-related protein [Thermococcus gorgonarius]ASJ00342.1 DNA helicase [Thermococcus gorgonarius]
MAESAIHLLDKYGLVDNNRVRLIDVLREVLTSGDYNRIDVAVGFLFISGMREIQNELEEFFSNGGKMRIVIGNQTNRETFEQLSMVYHSLEALQKIKRREKSVETNLDRQSEDIEKNTNFMEQTEENELFLRRLMEWILNNKLEIRIYVKEFMHAKAYLFYPSRPSVTRIGLVGSSNFTLAGFSGNTELNAIVQSTHFESLKEWYDKIWEEALPFNSKLLEIIESSWAGQVPGNLPLPWEVLIRGLYELYKEILERDTGFLLRKLENVLYPFQKDAVMRAISIVNKYGGVLISDVVGLGKSYIGLALLEHFSLLDLLHGRSREVAVIAPPGLVRYWEGLLWEYNIPGRVFSSGLLPRRELSPDKYREMEEYIKRVGTVLVDEAHHYSNPSTKSYKNLQELVAGKRLILLTATPYRKRYKDIISQIRLFLPERRHPFPITPQTWDDLTKAIEKGEIDPSYVFREILIRRTRYDILKLYGGEGNCIRVKKNKKLCFPKRKLSVLTYTISEIYSEDIYELLLEGISSMNYARFDLYSYVLPQFQDAEPYRSLSSAGKGLRGIMRILYLKRLESSWYAMYQTLKRDLIKTKNFINFVKNGFIPAGDEFDDVLLGKINGNRERVLSEEEVRDFIRNYRLKNEVTYKAGAFRVSKLLEDLKHDVGILELMEKRLRPLKENLENNSEKDPKLRKLAEEIIRLRQEGKKVLVFSEFEETVQWIYRGLKKMLPEDIAQKMEYVSSNTKGIADKIRRFAPKANGYKDIEESQELHILIATDVLSEGLNLQDANVVINYDLHWTPIKLIQRIGRVDRIGTEHDEILVYNFFPERKLEENLGLLQKVERRIQEFSRALGTDGKILQEEEEWNPSAMRAIYGTDEIEKIEDEFSGSLLSVTTFAEKLLRDYKEANEKRFNELIQRYSMRSIARVPKISAPMAFFVCSNGVISQYFVYYLADGKWKPQNVPIEQLLRDTGLDENTPPYNSSEAMETYRIVAKKALSDFKKLLKIAESELEYTHKRPSKIPSKIQLILRKIEEKIEKTRNPGEKEYLSQLRDLVYWGYLNHEPFKNALFKAKITKRTSRDEVINLCQELVERFGIAARRSAIKEEVKKRRTEGVKPHIVAGILFVPAEM